MKSVDVHQFSMVPKADIPRSAFTIETGHKTTFDAGYLVPVFCEEVLPGDTFNVQMTAFGRLATPLFPVMDNLHLDSFFFFVPNRLVWSNFQKFMGEQDNPSDSTSYVVPETTCPTGGYAVNSLQDYFGLPTVGQVDGASDVTHNCLPIRAYNLIWNQWFRDENLQDSVVVDKDDGPDDPADYVLLRRGKRHDYFTSCLPWPQKGEAVSLPLGTTADVVADSATASPTFHTASVVGPSVLLNATSGAISTTLAPAGPEGLRWTDPHLVADLSTATAATINQLRQAFQIQRLLERDARGGTRYTERVLAHFGVRSPDARLQRPEFLGGGTSRITLSPVAQTSETTATSQTPLATLAAIGTVVAGGHGFSQSFTEHGYVIGLVSVRADLSYQQGLRRMWSRSTQYDFYWPSFAHLGEQAVLTKEIFCDGTTADEDVFGYQERWAEYRHSPSKITGLFRSTAAGSLDAWHYSQEFSAAPVLNASFIQDAPPLERVLAVGAEANGSQVIFDSFFRMRMARAMPLYSTPGLIDHF